MVNVRKTKERKTMAHKKKRKKTRKLKESDENDIKKNKDN